MIQHCCEWCVYYAVVNNDASDSYFEGSDDGDYGDNDDEESVHNNQDH